VLVDAHVHLLPDRLARAIRRFFVERIPDYRGYPCELAPARAAIAAPGITRCWSLPYAHKPGMAHDPNRWMAETVADDGWWCRARRSIPPTTSHARSRRRSTCSGCAS
jgi:hypothetical protein